LVPPKNESALAQAMLKVAKTPEPELKKVIENAKNKVRKEYEHSVVIKRIENIYETEYKAGGN
jgi:glycosyltransferase involved in cell wall biosynthesis